jgi:hypothetical protein
MKLLLLFFVLMAALLVGVTIEIRPRAPAETAAICSASAPASRVWPLPTAR